MSRGSVILPYFFNDGSQRHIRGQSFQTCQRQFHHAATVGALQRQAERTPDGIVVDWYFEQVVQAGFTEGVRARQDPGVGEERVAHRACQVFLQGFHGGDESHGSGLRVSADELTEELDGKKVTVSPTD